MRPAARIASLAAFVVLGLGIAPARAALTDPPMPHPVLTALADGRALSIDEAKGHYLALHFVGACSSPAGTAFVRETIRNAPSVAGVAHAFISAEPAERVRAWVEPLGDDASMVYIDKDGALGADLGLRAGPSAGDAPVPATVVFDPDGKELFRVVGTGPDDYLPFDRFARQLADRSKPAALADYNLPKDKPLAVAGYDLVAYFTQSRAVQGKPEIASAYRGISYRFATEEDRRLFAASPTKYLPTYGGWCASAMGAKGQKVEIDPTSFKVKDGRLFLFYTGLFSSAINDWNKHERDWEPGADANWKRLTKEDPVKPSN
jgi:YHS domain-containing protein